jgi:1-acyl-sn-glycerol-3-phosphate acyltransferase
MCISPEGTRSKNGVLGRGKAGIVQLALDIDIPIMPVGHHGGENIWKNIKRFKRTNLYFKVGKPFKIRFAGKPCREEREEILTEVMVQMAKLLPVQMRGYYTEQAEKDCKYKYLDFLP